MGLMWSNADESSKIPNCLRHTCEQDEGMAGYGWASYDIRKGGVHIVNDTKNRVDLLVRYAKIQGSDSHEDWGLDVQILPRKDAPDHQETTAIFYIGIENFESKLRCKHGSDVPNQNKQASCDGVTQGLGDFNVRVIDHRPDEEPKTCTSVHSMTVPVDTIWKAKSILIDELVDKDRLISDSPGEGLVAPTVWRSAVPDNPGKGNLHFVQKTGKGKYGFDVLFSSKATATTVTPITVPKQKYVDFAKSLLSNLMGGIGFFYGTSKVDDSAAPEYAETERGFWEQAASARSHATVADKGPYRLFSSVPSRPFFPRGFLWDEGFHLQVILEWDMDLALEITSSWFNLMDENGWIAREQILGDEARSKVPPEFCVQYPHYANPPTLFIVIREFLTRLRSTNLYQGAPSRYLSDELTGQTLLKTLYSQMKRHYEWFRHTQAGNLTSYEIPPAGVQQGYRWRGRTPQHILTSGLDDYPRAQPPHPEELHLDALTWVGVMAMVLKDISEYLGNYRDNVDFTQQVDEIVRSIDSIHWSETDQVYCDTTVLDPGHVERICHKGYISLMPFVSGLMNSNHSHLESVLDLIRDPEELWSPFGIRSLSLKDNFYGTKENYWRGPIWININYMVVQRLWELAQQPGHLQQRALEIYVELRTNLVKTVFESWTKTGFAWEQYNPDTGRGQRTQHFTGWTSLIVKIMAMPDLQRGSQAQPAINQHGTNGSQDFGEF
ncbi:hypothetical protein G7Y79_00018g045350 [Physcia stellaris]|nr:hypothetical protein G7Y79_00018g045350 [Physcia stellaris]